MSGQSDIKHATASVIDNGARACRQAFVDWLESPNPMRRATLEVLMRGHEMDVQATLRRENAELKEQLEAMRAERARTVARLPAKPKLRLAAPEEGETT
jgi:hypothetical protein